MRQAQQLSRVPRPGEFHRSGCRSAQLDDEIGLGPLGPLPCLERRAHLRRQPRRQTKLLLPHLDRRRTLLGEHGDGFNSAFTSRRDRSGSGVGAGQLRNADEPVTVLVELIDHAVHLGHGGNSSVVGTFLSSALDDSPPTAPPISGVRRRFGGTEWTRKETEPQVNALRHTP